MKRIAVFCGSKEGARAVYKQEAVLLGKALAKQNLTLVYGGASTGLMGAVADAVIEAGGEVIGVLPKLLSDREIAHRHVTDLRIVNTMHERKAEMYELSDGFIALPGGIGTLEELVEVLTWNAIGEHQKPCGLLNIDKYYDPFLDLMDHMVRERFLGQEQRDFVVTEEQSEMLVQHFIDTTRG